MNNIKTVSLLALMSALLMVIGQVVGGSHGLIVMFILSLVMNFISYWKSDSIVLSMYDAKQVTPAESPQLFNMVAQLAKNGNLPMPKLYIIQNQVPNAFATGRNPEHSAVAVTTGLLDILTDDEIEGVVGHELTHIKHRDTLISTIAASMASAIAMLANVLQFGAIFGSHRDENGESVNPIALIATIILAPLAASLIQMGISRSREYLADEGGAEISRKPLALASALAKIEHYSRYGMLPKSEAAGEATAHMFIINPLGGLKDVASTLFSTHPSTASRIERLKEMASTRRY